MASLLSKEPVCQKEDSPLIDIDTVYRLIVSFIDAEKVWFIERSTVSRVERNLWKAAKGSKEHRGS